MMREDYSRRVLPHLKDDYFETVETRILFKTIKNHTIEYNTVPTPEVIAIDLQNEPHDTDSTLVFLKEFVKDLEVTDKSIEWLIDTTESFCQDRSLYIALEKTIDIAQGIDNGSGLSKGQLPQIFQDALNVSFDSKIGHDYIDDAESRYEFYHSDTERLKFDIDELNVITKGGLKKKTLNLIMAASGVGKSIVMCHCAAYWLSIGKNVLYITLELAEESVSERIDANLMGTEVDKVSKMSKNVFMSNIDKINSKVIGKLIVKEYPTSGANVGHFRYLLQELKTKKKFTPDVIIVDYVNICSSSKARSNANSYENVKSISEELRGLAVEYNIPLLSATQSGRASYDSSDMSATDVSESIGLVQTADLLIAMISNDELHKAGRLVLKTLKNRYGEVNTYHDVGIDRAKMSLYDIENSGRKNEEIEVSSRVVTGKKTGDKFASFIV